MENTISLNVNNQFLRTYKKGKSVVSNILVLYYIKNNNSTLNYLGITVSKKVGNAVTRNRVRRLIYENFRIREISLKTGYNIVFVARNSCKTATYDEVSRAMDFLIRKSDIKI